MAGSDVAAATGRTASVASETLAPWPTSAEQGIGHPLTLLTVAPGAGINVDDATALDAQLNGIGFPLPGMGSAG
jgi:hypothetical protein